MGESAAGEIAGVRNEQGVALLEWQPVERDVWAMPEPRPMTEWAQAHIRLPDGYGAIPGPLDLGLTPYLRGPLEAIDDPAVETVTVLAATQMGKTLLEYISILGGIVQRPGPRLLVMPTEPEAREVAGGLLREMALACGPIMERIGGGENLTKEGWRLATGGLYFGWSNSPASLSRRACREVYYDEVDKFPPYVGRETSPVALGDQRLRTYRNTTGAKSVRVSSPTTRDGLIWQSWLASDQRQYWTACAACGRYCRVNWDAVKWPHKKGGRSVGAEEVVAAELARYECPHCRERMDQHAWRAAVAGGVWAAEGEEIGGDGRIVGKALFPGPHRGFQMPAMLSAFTSLSELAGEWLRAQGDPVALQAMVNGQLAGIWEEVETATDQGELRKHRGEYLKARMDPKEAAVRGECPSEVQVVTCFVDVQKDFFVTSTRGWGGRLESWVLDWREIPNEEDLGRYIRSASFTPEGQEPLAIALTLIDSGDQTAYVYGLCDRWRDIDIRPTKGGNSDAMPPYRTSRRRSDPRTKRRYTADVVLYTLHPSYWKELQARQQKNTEPGPGYMHIPSDVDDRYLKQVTSEELVIDRRRGRGGRSAARPRKLWQIRAGHGANHWWDCECGNGFAAELLRLRYLANRGEAPPARRRRRIGRVER